ncbi:MAG TPA: alanine--tRNA ligase [Candidatus Cloacimonas sp.]|nr:alanine--tRNA ligase [Candidatus Cloacimonas sp.]HPS59819.1 alanine--tRNA ligase [Candidatus Cloacimonas sp.]
MLSSKEIRQQFIDFFISKGHTFVPSSSVIPENDNTLLFANAGMNQFKSIFLGQKEITHKRVVNSQKCIRAGGKHNDLEEVGKDGYHHTFFEMLGNWSFGDYYKKEAITWAWELLTEVWKIPKDKLYATVYKTDSEAFELWQKETDIDATHISYFDDKDNFWEMGETGPCGPCSEIHIDRGISHCTMQNVPGHICEINGICSRYIELWNLVFIQYNRQADKTLSPLKNKFVDTGAGFERLTQVLQDKNSNYETDLFMPLINKIEELSGVAYTQETGMPHRVIADHLRCLCFALADGGFPSNEGRGYVLRRILRRAARYGRLLGFAEPFLHLLVPLVIEQMGHHFSELNGKEDYLKMVIKAEEERFNKTLDTGLEKFTEITQKLQGEVISGADAFTLYDTYGFPLDLTAILAAEKGLKIDYAGFEKEMQNQKERARKASKFTLSVNNEEWIELSPVTATAFVGYTETAVQSYIQRYAVQEKGLILIQLAQTPFYAESGGQVSDTGKIYNAAFEVEITDVRKMDDYYLHYGNLTRGMLNNAPVTAEIDIARRKSIARNHTATHLLHKALREVLGEHTVQKGSLVHPDYLRFDFAHFRSLTLEELRKVEDIVNQIVLDNRKVSTTVKNIEDAKKEGAMALFGEKYSERVRVVSVQDFSQELCGGTHISATGEIGLFKIISESSSAAGIRRIEAITGISALKWVQDLQDKLSRIATLLNSPLKNLETKLEATLEQIAELEKEIKTAQAKENEKIVQELLNNATKQENYSLIKTQTNFTNPAELKQIAEQLKARMQGTIAVLFNLYMDKLNILCVVSTDLIPKYNAGKIVAKLAMELDGKGGGKPDIAMAGGKDITKLASVLENVTDFISSI